MDCASEPKLVESLVMPAMLAVPGFPEVRKILPDAGMLPPSVDCAWMPLMVNVSKLAVPLTQMVTVIVDDDTEMVALVIFLFVTKETVPELALNCHPLGAVRISVLPTPAVSAKSVLA